MHILRLHMPLECIHVATAFHQPCIATYSTIILVDLILIHIYIYIYIYIYMYTKPTSASCNWQQPPPQQVECLHQLKEGKHHKHKVQRLGFKMQEASISASWYGMQQQHATTTTTTTTTDDADMTNTARCSNHCNLREAKLTIHPINPLITNDALCVKPVHARKCQ